MDDETYKAITEIKEIISKIEEEISSIDFWIFVGLFVIIANLVFK